MSRQDKSFSVEEIDWFCSVRTGGQYTVIEVKPPIQLHGPAFMKAVLGVEPPENVASDAVMTTSDSTLFYAEDSNARSFVQSVNLRIVRERIDEAVNHQGSIASMMLDRPFDHPEDRQVEQS
jgi:hypothetical protein